MSYEVPGLMASFNSSGNLSGKQYFLVKPATAVGAVTFVTAVTDEVLGVLQNTPTTGGGDAAAVMLNGISKVYKNTTGAAITYGDPLIPTTAGGVTTSTSKAVTNYVIGQALETVAAATTGLVTMFINHNGRGSSGD